MNINLIIEYICDDLDIDPPKIKMADSLSGTTLALYNYKNKELTILKHYTTQLDCVFAIAHELRHKYQCDTRMFDFSNYKTRDELDIYEYNMQIQELDANAYAYIFVNNELGVYPKFEGMDSRIKNAILDRVDYILANEYE